MAHRALSSDARATPAADLVSARLTQTFGMDEQKKSKRGFASMNPERQREIASRGGKSVPSEKHSFSQSPELAAKAGRKGSAATQTQSKIPKS